MIEPKLDINISTQQSDIQRSEISNELSEIIKRVDTKNFKSIYAFYPKFIEEINIIVTNLKKKGTSEVLISYGNNSDLSKTLITKALEDFREREKSKVVVKILNLNAFIHDKEDEVLSKICTFFELESEKKTFESIVYSIENYFKYFEVEDNTDMDLDVIDTLTLKNCSKKSKIKTIYVIFYENIEFLFHKQKQVLFYTILEIVNMSKNILFCGTTRYYDLTHLMEKRIRSRFSQKTFFMDVISKNDIGYSLKYLVSSGKEESRAAEVLYERLAKNEFFLKFIEKNADLGISVRDLFFKLRLLFSNLLADISKENTNTACLIEELDRLIELNMRRLFSLSISSLEYLYKLPKLHITVLSVLLKSLTKHRDKIILGMLYDQYKLYTRNNEITMKPEIVKKVLEELNSSGLIYCKPDDKYTFVYEIKHSVSETKSAILKLINDPKQQMNFQHLKKFLNEIVCNH